MKRHDYFGLSILIHGLTLSCFAFFLEVQKPKTSDVVAIELTPIQRDTQPTKFISKQGVSSKVAKGLSSSKKIGIFGQSYAGSSKTFHLESSLLEGKAAAYNESSNYEASADSFLANTDQWSYFQQVFQRIDQQLIFDSLLAQYNHFGYVYVEFEVGPDGRFVDKSLKVSAIDSILKVHALKALRKGLIEEFPSEKWNPDGKSVRFQAKFEFLEGSENLNFTKQKDFGKAKLVFRRASSEKPIPNSLKEQLLTGGISHDPFAMAERWEKYNKKKRLKDGDFDPFAPYRADPDYNL